MRLLIDSFWRAAASCLHPRVMLLSLLPLLIMVVLALTLGQFFWTEAVDAVRQFLDSSPWLGTLMQWLEQQGLGAIKTVAAQLLVIFGVTPVLVLGTLLVVTFFMTPSLVRWVAQRRFAHLALRNRDRFWQGIGRVLLAVLTALVLMVLSLPLWLIPPLGLLLPALIGGWLTARLMAEDALAQHADDNERETLLLAHRWPMLAMGMLTGVLSAGPSLLWASTAMFAMAFLVLLPLALWVYTLVFAFSSLWFAHYALAALAAQRAQERLSTIDAVA